MGRDSVVECINDANSVRAYSSYTVVGGGKYDSPREGVVSSFT